MSKYSYSLVLELVKSFPFSIENVFLRIKSVSRPIELFSFHRHKTHASGHQNVEYRKCQFVDIEFYVQKYNWLESVYTI